MATLDVINQQNIKVSVVEISEDLLTKPANQPLVYLAVKRQLSATHHGTVKTQTRAEVSRTGKKVYRQKGTGAARHGSRRPAPYVGGGRVFGPKPRDYTEGMTKQARKLALGEGIRVRLQKNELALIESMKLAEIKTSQALALLKTLDCANGVLIILEHLDTAIEKSFRNLKQTKVVSSEQLNIVDVLKYPKVLCEAKAFELLRQRGLIN